MKINSHAWVLVGTLDDGRKYFAGCSRSSTYYTFDIREASIFSTRESARMNAWYNEKPVKINICIANPFAYHDGDFS